VSNYFNYVAASEIAAAFRALPVGVEVFDAAPALRHRITGTGLSDVVFGKGHPPRRGIPL